MNAGGVLFVIGLCATTFTIGYIKYSRFWLGLGGIIYLLLLATIPFYAE